MPGIEKFLKGVLKYNKDLKPYMVKQFKAIKDNPKENQPISVTFSCIDSRVMISQVLQSEVGNMFLVRNAGNFVPHASLCNAECTSTEPAALELGCKINNVPNVMVVGHSDCKAMIGLHGIMSSKTFNPDSPLNSYLQRHGQGTVKQFKLLETIGSLKPINFKISAKKTIEAYIDPENHFDVFDKFSQLNTLQQLHNVASYPFMEDMINDGSVAIHAFWFDVHTGHLHMFSHQEKRFVVVNDQSANKLS